MFGWRVRVLAGLIVLTAALADCSDPPAWQATDKLLPKAGPLCTTPWPAVLPVHQRRVR